MNIKRTDIYRNGIQYVRAVLDASVSSDATIDVVALESLEVSEGSNLNDTFLPLCYFGKLTVVSGRVNMTDINGNVYQLLPGVYSDLLFRRAEPVEAGLLLFVGMRVEYTSP
jgi:hypothetical protein